MMKINTGSLLVTLCCMSVNACSSPPATPAKVTATVATTGPYGKAEDIAFAAGLWQALTAAALAGPAAVQSYPYGGQSPHGEVLQYIDTTLTVSGQTTAVIVLNNYSGSGINSDLDIDNVAKHPQRYLQTVQVMYKRPGYDRRGENGQQGMRV
jgi:hypothetical protein